MTTSAATDAVRAFHSMALAVLTDRGEVPTARSIARVIGISESYYSSARSGRDRFGSLESVSAWLVRWRSSGLGEYDLVVHSDQTAEIVARLAAPADDRARLAEAADDRAELKRALGQFRRLARASARSQGEAETNQALADRLGYSVGYVDNLFAPRNAAGTINSLQELVSRWNFRSSVQFHVGLTKYGRLNVAKDPIVDQST